MNINNFLKKAIGLKEHKDNTDIDSIQTTLSNREIIQSKPFLKKIYIDHYSFILKEIKSCPKGLKLEIGSGGSFLKNYCPDVITTDVLELPYLDKVCSALDLPFEDNSLACICMTDVFHHLPDAELFLKEAQRCLVLGGKIIMIEPANTLWGRFVYKNLHHEPFHPESKEWKLPPGGPMSTANGALPYIVFERDKEVFEQKFQMLQITSLNYCHPFRYLISGGVSMRALAPSFTYPLIAFIEDKLLSFASAFLGMFMRITVEKREH